MSTHHYFLLGIKGSAMAHIAVILKKQGHMVTGYDIVDEFPTDEILKKNDISWTDNTVLPRETDIIIYSAAHKGIHNPLVVQAKEKGIKIQHQAELLGELLLQFQTSLAVAGCHGKTTTSSLLAYTLIQMGKKPSYLIGAPSFNEYTGGAINNHDYFVIEADEYAMSPPDNLTPKFHSLKPTYSIITNIDFDHPDVYVSLEQTQHVFRKYCQQIIEHYPNIQCLVLCGEDKPLMEVASHLPQYSYITYGFSPHHTYTAGNISYLATGSAFDISHKKILVERFETSLFGEKNVLNATGVIALLLHLGFEPVHIKKAIKDFTGAKRRFELIGEYNNTYLFDDYAHHPEEIKAVIASARSRFPEKRIILVFQPHTYSRTHALKDQFVEALAKADYSILLPIFGSAREISPSAHTIDEFKNEANKRKSDTLVIVNDTSHALQLLKQFLKPGDIVITTGAGDVYKLKDDILSLITSLASYD